MNSSEHIINFLNEHNIAYQCYRHKPIYTLDDGVEITEAIGIKPCKCLLLVNRRHQHYMLLTQGDTDVNLHLLAGLIHSSRLSFATADALDTLLHTIPGAVSPLGLIFDTELLVRLMLDERVLQCQKLMMAPCVNDESIVMETQDFINIFLPASKHPNYQIIKSVNHI